jgi:hypothetical protein
MESGGRAGLEQKRYALGKHIITNFRLGPVPEDRWYASAVCIA